VSRQLNIGLEYTYIVQFVIFVAQNYSRGIQFINMAAICKQNLVVAFLKYKLRAKIKSKWRPPPIQNGVPEQYGGEHSSYQQCDYLVSPPCFL